MASADGPSGLSEAVNEKYGQKEAETDPQNVSDPPVNVIIRCPDRGTSLRHVKALTLNQHGLSTLGDVSWLNTSCPNVCELDLACNSFSSWKEISGLFMAFPRLSFLNLTDNPLHRSPAELATPSLHAELKTLILNKTNVQWQVLESLLGALEGLQELHISMNGYTDIGLAGEFPQIKRLHVNKNPLADISPLGKHFPTLETLIAHGLPVDHVKPDTFEQLQMLSLPYSSIADWHAIETLGKFQSLSQLKLQGIPLLDAHKEDKRRSLLVASLPKIERLNGSAITDEERKDSARNFIACFVDMPREQQPSIFHRLLEKQGVNPKRAIINMDPVTRADVYVIFEDMAPVKKRIDRTQSVVQLKQELSQEIVGLPPAMFEVIYEDMEPDGTVYWREKLQPVQRKLYSYRIKDNDKLVVRLQ
eukprot:m.13166 g.13166  ORF g.13166 m.13166 type:complete len:419 (+) comp24512_c0_seq4:52-1308(+)